MRFSTRLFFFNDTAPPEIYALSLHAALPISRLSPSSCLRDKSRHIVNTPVHYAPEILAVNMRHRPHRFRRSEEHTSELQSHLNPVCRLLLEKKKNITTGSQMIRPHNHA